jgi:hypothetical protein
MKDNKGTWYPFSKSKQKFHARAFILIILIFAISLIYKFSYLINFKLLFFHFPKKHPSQNHY